jgi:hypothetical protein
MVVKKVGIHWLGCEKDHPACEVEESNREAIIKAWENDTRLYEDS